MPVSPSFPPYPSSGNTRERTQPKCPYPTQCTLFSDQFMLNLPFGCNHSLRPILPKQTQLTKSTLAIHVATATLSRLNIPATSMPASFSCCLLSVVLAAALARAAADGDGAGTRSGFMESRRAVPLRATVELRMKPGEVRSRRYQIAGLARARVRLSWRVDCQGRRRCKPLLVQSEKEGRRLTHNSKGNADRGTNGPDNVVPNRRPPSTTAPTTTVLCALLATRAPVFLAYVVGVLLSIPYAVHIRHELSQQHSHDTPESQVFPCAVRESFE